VCVCVLVFACVVSNVQAARITGAIVHMCTYMAYKQLCYFPSEIYQGLKVCDDLRQVCSCLFRHDTDLRCVCVYVCVCACVLL
jgi:hypothetical protein